MAAQGPASVDIAQSWRRSASYGLSPHQPLSDLPAHDVDVDSAWLQAALPLVEQALDDVSAAGYGFILCDEQARLVHFTSPVRPIRDLLERNSVRRGVAYSEEVVGTNALGMAIELRRQVCVGAGEHYNEALRPIACVGQPVIHPLTRRTLGVIDLTGDASVTHPLARRLVSDLAGEVERRVLEGSSRAQLTLMAAFRVAGRHNSRPVVALDDDVLLANQPALDLLHADDLGMLRALLADRAGLGATRLAVRLANGKEVGLQAEGVEGTRGGVLLSLDAQASAARRSSRPQRAARRLATRSGECVLVSGPPGSGRTTAVAEHADGRTVHTIPVELALVDGGQAWLEALAGACGQSPPEQHLVCVEEIGLLPEPLLVHLMAVQRRGCRPALALTSAPVSDLAGRAAAVAGTCTSRVALPALADRRAELRELAQRIIADIDPEASLRLTPSVLAALGAHHWPGNLSELRTVLAHVCAQRSSGDVVLADLPADYRLAQPARRLGGLEQAERDAIVQALARSGGNKAQAAAELGISRTTLYARIRQLRVSA